MSWGYVPKKLRQARRQKNARKKYKGFSCETCRRDKKCWWCPYFDYSRAFKDKNGKWQMKDCKYWRASEEAKHALKKVNVQQPPGKKQPRKGIMSRIFK